MFCFEILQHLDKYKKCNTFSFSFFSFFYHLLRSFFFFCWQDVFDQDFWLRFTVGCIFSSYMYFSVEIYFLLWNCWWPSRIKKGNKFLFFFVLLPSSQIIFFFYHFCVWWIFFSKIYLAIFLSMFCFQFYFSLLTKCVGSRFFNLNHHEKQFYFSFVLFQFCSYFPLFCLLFKKVATILCCIYLLDDILFSDESIWFRTP